MRSWQHKRQVVKRQDAKHQAELTNIRHKAPWISSETVISDHQWTLKRSTRGGEQKGKVVPFVALCRCAYRAARGKIARWRNSVTAADSALTEERRVSLLSKHREKRRTRFNHRWPSTNKESRNAQSLIRKKIEIWGISGRMLSSNVKKKK